MDALTIVMTMAALVCLVAGTRQWASRQGEPGLARAGCATTAVGALLLGGVGAIRLLALIAE